MGNLLSARERNRDSEVDPSLELLVAALSNKHQVFRG
jgi:hypothetical protein